MYIPCKVYQYVFEALLLGVYTKSSVWGYLYGVMVVQSIVGCTVLNESLLSGEFQVFRFVHIIHCLVGGLVVDTNTVTL